MLNYALVFFAGVLTGALGTYYADWWTNWRREREAARKAGERFEEVRRRMPEFLERLRADLEVRPENALVRDFYVLPKADSKVGIPGKIPAFGYRATDIPHLAVQAIFLENHGYVQDITESTPRYRMTEEFVASLRSLPEPLPPG